MEISTTTAFPTVNPTSADGLFKNNIPIRLFPSASGPSTSSDDQLIQFFSSSASLNGVARLETYLTGAADTIATDYLSLNINTTVSGKIARQEEVTIPFHRAVLTGSRVVSDNITTQVVDYDVMTTPKYQKVFSSLVIGPNANSAASFLNTVMTMDDAAVDYAGLYTRLFALLELACTTNFAYAVAAAANDIMAHWPFDDNSLNAATAAIQNGDSFSLLLYRSGPTVPAGVLNALHAVCLPYFGTANNVVQNRHPGLAQLFQTPISLFVLGPVNLRAVVGGPMNAPTAQDVLAAINFVQRVTGDMVGLKKGLLTVASQLRFLSISSTALSTPVVQRFHNFPEILRGKLRYINWRFSNIARAAVGDDEANDLIAAMNGLAAPAHVGGFRGHAANVAAFVAMLTGVNLPNHFAQAIVETGNVDRALATYNTRELAQLIVQLDAANLLNTLRNGLANVAANYDPRTQLAGELSVPTCHVEGRVVSPMKTGCAQLRHSLGALSTYIEPKHTAITFPLGVFRLRLHLLACFMRTFADNLSFENRIAQVMTEASEGRFDTGNADVDMHLSQTYQVETVSAPDYADMYGALVCAGLSCKFASFMDIVAAAYPHSAYTPYTLQVVFPTSVGQIITDLASGFGGVFDFKTLVRMPEFTDNKKVSWGYARKGLFSNEAIGMEVLIGAYVGFEYALGFKLTYTGADTGQPEQYMFQLPSNFGSARNTDFAPGSPLNVEPDAWYLVHPYNVMPAVMRVRSRLVLSRDTLSIHGRARGGVAALPHYGRGLAYSLTTVNNLLRVVRRFAENGQVFVLSANPANDFRQARDLLAMGLQLAADLPCAWQPQSVLLTVMGGNPTVRKTVNLWANEGQQPVGLAARMAAKSRKETGERRAPLVDPSARTPAPTLKAEAETVVTTVLLGSSATPPPRDRPSVDKTEDPHF